MQAITTAVYATARRLGLNALARWLGGGVVLCYHNVVADGPRDAVGDPGLHLALAAFHAQMEWLAAHYTVLPLAQFVQLTIGGASLRRVATITFDDAYAGVLNNALPLLQQLGLPATLFVVTQAPEGRQAFWWDHPAVQSAATPERRKRWLSALRGDGDAILEELGVGDRGALSAEYLPADWRALAAAAHQGVALGAHSAMHRALPQLNDIELERELTTSRAELQRHTGVAPQFFAHPYGLWDARVRHAVHAAGFEAAFTLDYGLVRARADRWALPRVNVPATIGRAAFEAWCAGLNLRQIVRGDR